jgi:hypothetical protein
MEAAGKEGDAAAAEEATASEPTDADATAGDAGTETLAAGDGMLSDAAEVVRLLMARAMELELTEGIARLTAMCAI